MSVSSDAIVNRLLQGDTIEPKKRLQNISTAMSWIQQELEGMKQSDRTLLSLFQQLESDMSEVKSEPRGQQHQCTVSPMNGLLWKGKTDSMPMDPIMDTALYSVPEHKSMSSLDFPPALKRLNIQGTSASSIFRQMEEEDEEEDELAAVEDSNDSDSGSLDDFADTLGGDDDVEVETIGGEIVAQTVPASQLPVSRTLYHQSAPHLREKEYDSVSAGSRGSQSSGLATVGILTHPSSSFSADSPKLHQRTIKPITRNLSNDSGVQFCTTDTESNGAGQGSTSSMAAATVTQTKVPEDKKDPGSFADEIFAMLKF